MYRKDIGTARIPGVSKLNTSHRQARFFKLMLNACRMYCAYFYLLPADLHRKLEKVYKEGVEEKDKLIESSKLLFASREEAENRIRYLKEKSSRDVASFNAELKDLMRIIDHDKRLREFMTTKEIDLTEVYDRVIQSR